jgi:flagellar biosynthesis protein FlhF
MQTKQFTGDTIDDVLTQVRGELGDDAVILETRNIVRGGIAGFFGKAGIEVTAADRMPDPDGTAGARRVDLLDTAESQAAPAGGPVDPDDFLRRLGQHFVTGEAPVAAGTSVPPAADGAQRLVDDRERARAIIEAARAAVREAAAAQELPPATSVQEQAGPAGDHSPFVPGPLAMPVPEVASPPAPAAEDATAAAPGIPESPRPPSAIRSCIGPVRCRLARTSGRCATS